mmetsp:Transcript_12857/g.36567  ORF Transcript_12857/g.36567 Transcript_12857/m.36567 type:complete len:222 (+) Transcript_12857:171-836(+)
MGGCPGAAHRCAESGRIWASVSLSLKRTATPGRTRSAASSLSSSDSGTQRSWQLPWWWSSLRRASSSPAWNLTRKFPLSRARTMPRRCRPGVGPSAAAARTKSPASSGRPPRRRPLSGRSSRRRHGRLRPSAVRTFVVMPSMGSPTTPRQGAPAASEGGSSTREPGLESSSASCASSRHSQGSKTACCPGWKSTAAALPSVDLTRPRSPGLGAPPSKASAS